MIPHIYRCNVLTYPLTLNTHIATSIMYAGANVKSLGVCVCVRGWEREREEEERGRRLTFSPAAAVS